MACKIPTACGLYSFRGFALKLLVKRIEEDYPFPRDTLER